jgi:hypothetical protein
MTSPPLAPKLDEPVTPLFSDLFLKWVFPNEVGSEQGPRKKIAGDTSFG